MKQLEYSFFEKEFNDVLDVYQGKYTNPKIFNRIYEKLKYLKNDQLKKVIEHVIDNVNYKAPSPADFEKLADPFLQKNRQDQKEKEMKEYTAMFSSEHLALFSKSFQKGINENKPEVINKTIMQLRELRNSGAIKTPKCKHCDDTGFIYATKRNKPHMADTVFNCFCEKSTKDKRFDTWGRRLFDEFMNKNLRDEELRRAS